MTSDSDDLTTWWSEVDPIDSIDAPDSAWDSAVGGAFDPSFELTADHTDPAAGFSADDDDEYFVDDAADIPDGHDVEVHDDAFVDDAGNDVDLDADDDLADDDQVIDDY